jgi:hypothetical protein
VRKGREAARFEFDPEARTEIPARYGLQPHVLRVDSLQSDD